MALFFLAMAAVATRPLAFDLAGSTLRGPDPLIDLWTAHWLTSHALEPGRLFGGNVFAPFPGAVLHSDLSLGTAVLLLPLRPFVSDPVPLYNLGVLLALAFAGWSFHLLVRALTGDPWAGLVAGVLAAFSSHQLYHVYHLNLLSVGWLAIFLLGLHRLLARPSGGSVLLTGLAFALAALSSGYYAVAAAALGLLFAAFHARRFGRRALAAAFLAALLGAALVAPYARAFTGLRDQTRLRRPRGLSVRMAFRPARDLGSRAYLDAPLVGGGGEKLFPGVLALALASLGLARRRPHSGFHALAAAVMLLLALGPSLELFGRRRALPYGWLSAVPPLDSMRHPYTFAAVAVLLLAVSAGLAAATRPASARRRSGPLLLALAVAETLGPPVAVRPVPPGLPPAYELARRLPAGILLELPVTAPEAMLWAARHGLPVANGIGAFSPGETLRLQHLVRRHWLARAPEDVDTSPPARLMREVFGVRYVVLPGGRRPAYRRLARAFDRSSSFALVAEFPDGGRLYELHSPGSFPGPPGLPRERSAPGPSKASDSPERK